MLWQSTLTNFKYQIDEQNILSELYKQIYLFRN
jgi:hypothetical protein